MYQFLNRTYWKIRSRNYLLPVTNFFIANQISPNVLTLCAFFFGICTALVVFTNYYLFLLFLFLHTFFDTMDGAVAREMHQQSKLGDILDKAADNIVGILLILSALGQVSNDWYVFAAVGLYCIFMLVAGHIWKTSLLPNTVLLKIFYICRLYELGIVLQAIAFPVQFILGRFVLKGKLDDA